MQKVIIASKNPVKINAIKEGFKKMLSDTEFDFISISVSSEISNQPFGDKETLAGAINRVKNARIQNPDADYWVGIEGGIEKIDEKMESFAWVIIKSPEKYSKSRTGTFLLPAKVVKIINEGKELGEADDIVFNKNNSKQNNGAVGILTANIIDRTRYYFEAVVLALIPFKNKSLY